MAETTNISWCDHTHNEWIGCTKISPACDGCYAANLMDNRLGRVKWGVAGKGNGERDRTSVANRKEPFKWNRKAEKAGIRSFVFGGSLNDPFDNQVPAQWRKDYFHNVIEKTPHLIWMLLTKRPGNIIEMCEDLGGLPRNVALGTTAENQIIWDRNVGKLATAKAQLNPLFTFVSVEPMLGPIDPHRALITSEMRRHFAFYARQEQHHFNPIDARQDRRFRLDWIITGGETNQGTHRARPFNPEWARVFRDACAMEGIAYHHKQNGEFAPVEATDGPGELYSFPDGRTVRRVGKDAAGRLLDGVTHDERPDVVGGEL